MQYRPNKVWLDSESLLGELTEDGNILWHFEASQEQLKQVIHWLLQELDRSADRAMEVVLIAVRDGGMTPADGTKKLREIFGR